MALARWYKVDFHTHTPESRCFPDKRVTPDMWLKKAKESGINAVVVSDHNSVGYISRIENVKKQYEDDNFKVFYGIELCVSADFTHFLIIFDDKMTVTEIEDAVISNLKLKRSDWADTEINVSEDRLKDLCIELENKIFVIPAHFASNKGLGKSTINAIKKYQEFLKFSAVEIRNEEDIREYDNKVKANVINNAVLITGSDNPSASDESQHSIDGFGKMFTWVKLSSLSFEGLKQVFIDPEHRCLNWLDIQKIGVDFNPNEITYNYVSGIEVEGISHMTKMNMRFSPNLNCIVGGRGTGKSTIVDAINYGVGNERELSKCKLLDKTLDKGGKLSTYYNFGSNKPYKIEMSRKGKQLESKIIDDDGVVENPPEFKVDFYGQKEIFNLIDGDDSISNQGISPLVKMIDDKVSTEIYSYSDEIDQALLEMIKYSDEYKNNRKKIREMPTIKAEIEKADAILKKFKASGVEKARANFETIDAKIKNIEKLFSTKKNLLEESISQYKEHGEEINNQLEELKLYDETNKIEIETVQEILKCNNEISAFLNQKLEAIETIEKQYVVSATYIKREEMHKEYIKALEDIQNTGGEDINLLQDQLQKNRQRYEELLNVQKEQGKLVEKIEESINPFVQKRLDLSQKREHVIQKMDLENIMISITPMGHIARWKANMQREFGREGIFDNDFQGLSDYILSNDNNWKHYKDFLKFLLTTDSGEIESIGITPSDIRFGKLWRDKFNNDTLSALVKVIPEDKLKIKIIEETGEIDINEGSPGQKSAAILAFILNSGENPLIIDQPEDDLDNSLIYNLVVRSIRKMKNKRQIIIVTHNPNIPVLGDAEAIIVLERNSDGKVTFRKGKKAGCIEEKVIREGICDIMEGGEEAFRKREKKYQYK